MEYDYDDGFMDESSGIDYVEPKQVIDRDAEDLMVEEYNKTKNPLLLEKIIEARMPTIKFWSIKWNKYLNGFATKEDLVSGIKVHVLKNIHSYKREKGSYNTFIYTLINNYIKNCYCFSSCARRNGEKFVFNTDREALDQIQDNIRKNGDTTSSDIEEIEESVLDKAVTIIKQHMRVMTEEQIKESIKLCMKGYNPKSIHRIRNSIRRDKNVYRETKKKVLELL